MISVTPHLAPLRITLNHPEWDGHIELYDLDEAARLGATLLDAVKLLRLHARNVAGGAATKGITSARKRRASRANGRRGGRPQKQT